MLHVIYVPIARSYTVALLFCCYCVYSFLFKLQVIDAVRWYNNGGWYIH